jgi:hypothetical protein
MTLVNNIFEGYQSGRGQMEEVPQHLPESIQASHEEPQAG